MDSGSKAGSHSYGNAFHFARRTDSRLYGGVVSSRVGTDAGVIVLVGQASSLPLRCTTAGFFL